MLKAIELNGFKSFADRTRLEFSEGISALVGPNGSGKSNIVDAIKWVLGEQSVKKLRGNEMTDVIFGGSGTRQPLGAAEVTLSFDNGTKIFDIDAPEVHITRRVYRSGESEYLINRQTSKLKSIKELLSGTGLGAQALSIIEQGRVQSLLESAPSQRRALFDEAAGVSRFNAKKIESQRRLERVEQNLIRLSDIVNDLENRLKSVKAQAGKAQLYRQYTKRLQELRTESSLIDWRRLEEGIQAARSEMKTLESEENRHLAEAESYENNSHEINSEIEELESAVRKKSGELAAVIERILGEESTIELQMGQLEEIESEIVRHGRQLIEMNLRSVDTEEMMRRTEADIISAKKFHREVSEQYRRSVMDSEKLNMEFERKQTELSSLGKAVETKNRESSRLSGEIDGIGSRLESLQNDRERAASLFAESNLASAETESALRKAVDDCEESHKNLEKRSEQLEAANRVKNARESELESNQTELASLKQELSRKTERISVLKELLEAHEGLSPGVKEVLRLSRNPMSPFRFAHGLVADLLNVDFDLAPLIELALGSSAQHIVVSPEPELFKYLESNSKLLPGRVGFIWLDPNPVEASWMRNNSFENRPGVLGRADRFVRSDPQFAHLAHRLLARTWIVRNLSIAKSLYRESDDRTNFITVNGEYLASDGSIVLGPVTASSGIITRRTELRSLSEELESLEGRVREFEISGEVLKNRLRDDERRAKESDSLQRKAQSELDTMLLKRNAIKERHEQSLRECGRRKAELEAIEAQLYKTNDDLTQAEMRGTLLEDEIRNLEFDLKEAEREFDAADLSRKDHVRKTSGIHIELAKSEERLSFLQDRIKQFEDRQRERANLLDEHRRRMISLQERGNSTSLSILKIESSLAHLYLRKETLAVETAKIQDDRAKFQRERDAIRQKLKAAQSEATKIRAKNHARQLELERLQQEQNTLVERLKEDYHIDLTEMDIAAKNRDEVPVDDESENDSSENPKSSSPEDYRAEIDDLRNKIRKIGNVNLEAIDTLEELEVRFTTHSNQYNDLISAKKTIEKIIEKTNNDSQQLFEETFEGVKRHFSELFQRFFGGGFADIVFDDPGNPLESGVDIVARPPGKELSSIMLMSGGEKTLTCVALLLAFFKYRPNPVCILDEVDAALDEGNIDRFVNVVSDFRTSTQFLIVTHSKKTMACAKTIYGITMQDSGVSKPISVRFLDVGENGEILDKEATEGPSIFKIDTENRTKAA